MASGLDTDVRGIVLSNTTFGPVEIKQLTLAVQEDFSNFAVLRDAVAELEVSDGHSPATTCRLGVCYYLLGRFRQAVEALQKSDGSALSLFYLGRSQFELGDYEAALKQFESAKKAGYDADWCSLAKAEIRRYQGDVDGAMATLDDMYGPVEQTAEYLYQRGATVAAKGGNPAEVVALYERAVEADSRHAGALFGLALESDRRGNDEVALQLYRQATACFPTHVGALLNLGVLFEDQLQFDQAQACYRRILDVFPGHARAQLYLKDALASSDMYYDEDRVKANDRLAQILNIPVTDFELSVRSRNCLQKMGILTLGDLCRATESDLLASKNFGETSLVEIREMLASKGLKLGQYAAAPAEQPPAYDPGNLAPEEQALYERSIAELNLSVRARKCMVRLGLNTIGELVRKSGDDLLECKNFGVTSLNEVREKLAVMDLKLRGD